MVPLILLNIDISNLLMCVLESYQYGKNDSNSVSSLRNLQTGLDPDSAVPLSVAVPISWCLTLKLAPKSKLNRKNKTMATNPWAVTVLKYSVHDPISDELKVRNRKTLHDALNPEIDVDRL